MPLTARQAARRVRGLKAVLERNVTQAVADTIQDAKRTAIAHSRGRYSLAELARLGHPYAIRHLFATAGGTTPFGGAVINYQTGLFADSWFGSTPTRRSDGRIAGKVFNTAPYATFLEHGTVLMWARPVNAVVAREVQPRFERRMKRALSKTFGSL